ncbi:MAG: hypothetical protein WBL67_14810 [Nitrososphaeraceae archaeon]
MRDSECTKGTNPILRSSFRSDQPCLVSEDWKQNMDCPLQKSVLKSLQNYTLLKPPVLKNTFQGRIDAFALLEDGKIWHGLYESNRIIPWHNIASEILPLEFNFTTQPSVISKSIKVVDLELYSQTADGTLIKIEYDGSKWSPGTPLEKIPSEASVVYWNNPELKS